MCPLQASESLQVLIGFPYGIAHETRTKIGQKPACSQHHGATMGPYIIASDGDEVHGVVHRLEDAQDGAQRLLQVLCPFTVLAVLEHFLKGNAGECSQIPRASLFSPRAADCPTDSDTSQGLKMQSLGGWCGPWTDTSTPTTRFLLLVRKSFYTLPEGRMTDSWAPQSRSYLAGKVLPCLPLASMALLKAQEQALSCPATLS